MANRFFQGIIHQLSDAIDRQIGILDDTGTIIARSALSDIGSSYHGYSRLQPDENGVVRYENNTYTTLSGLENPTAYTVFVAGAQEGALRLARPSAAYLRQLKQRLYDH